MARNPGVDRARLEVWMGLVGFFAFMALVSLVMSFVTGTNPLLPLVVAGVFVGAFVLLFRTWRRGS